MVAGFALGAGVLTPVQAAPSEDPDVRDAAGFLGRQLVENGYRMPAGSAGGVDWGLTLDAVLALTAAGVGKDVVDRTVDTILSDEFTYLASQNADNMGAFAKTALVLQVAGRPAVLADGTDLEALVRSKIQSSGRAGRTTNHFGQALAVLMLARTPGGVPHHVVDFTATHQCRDVGSANFGGFSWSAGSGACRSVDGDATGMIGSALLAVRAQVEPEVFADAVGWVEGQQRPDGSFAAGFSGSGNTNSAGLVSQFARATGTPAGIRVAESADRYLTSLMVGCSQPVNFDATSTATGGGFWTQWRGAIAYDVAALEKGIASGVSGNLTDQWRRASAQAVLGMSGVPGFGELSTVGMSTDLPEPSVCALDVTAPVVTGSPRVGGVLTAVTAGFRSGTVTHTGAPELEWQWMRDGVAIEGATAATHTVTAEDAGEPLTVRVTVVEPGWTGSAESAATVAGDLPAGTFALTTTRERVVHGRSTWVVATGLASEEQWTLRLGGVQVATGRADRAGEVRTTFVVPRGSVTARASELVLSGRSAARAGRSTLWVLGPARLQVRAPQRPSHRGTVAVVTASGLQPQETWTLTVSGRRLAHGRADALGRATARFTVPRTWGTARGRATVLTGESPDRAGRTALATTARARLTVRVAKKTVKRRTTQKVTVAGLLPGERVQVTAGAAKARRGVAGRNGRYVVRLSTGARARTVVVTATGGASERTGRTTYRVR